MISAYVSDLVDLLIEIKLFSKEEMQKLLQISSENLEAIQKGDHSKLTLNNLECLISILGMQCLDSRFIVEVTKGSFQQVMRFSDEYRTISNKADKLRTYFNDTALYTNSSESNNIVVQLNRILENQKYIEDCELIVDTLKDSGIYTEQSDFAIAEESQNEAALQESIQ
jgi:hypothetical protein